MGKPKKEHEYQEFAIPGLAVDFGMDRRTIARKISELGVPPVRTKTIGKPTNYYYLKDAFRAFVLEHASGLCKECGGPVTDPDPLNGPEFRK